jgi:argininosuccinate lyase
LLDSRGKNSTVQGHKNLIEWISKNQHLILETDLSELQEADAENFFALDSLEDALRGFRTMLWEFSLKQQLYCMDAI